MAAILWQIARRGLLRRQRLKLYLIAYCAFRFSTEFIRPEPRVIGGLTAYQWGALAMAAALIVQWRFDRMLLIRGTGTPPMQPAAPAALHASGEDRLASANHGRSARAT